MVLTTKSLGTNIIWKLFANFKLWFVAFEKDSAMVKMSGHLTFIPSVLLVVKLFAKANSILSHSNFEAIQHKLNNNSMYKAFKMVI